MFQARKRTIRLLVGKDRPGDVRAHAGPMGRDRLQPWAKIVIDSTKPERVTWEIKALEVGDDEDGPDDGLFVPDGPPWQHVVIPDAFVHERLSGKGAGVAVDIVRILYRSGTFDGVTRGDVQSQYAEGLKGRKRDAARSRFGHGWQCLDRAGVLGANGARYTLAHEVITLLDAHNVE